MLLWAIYGVSRLSAEKWISVSAYARVDELLGDNSVTPRGAVPLDAQLQSPGRAAK